MFDLVGRPVHAARGEVREVDQIQLPQPMVAGGEPCAAGTFMREPVVIVGVESDYAIAHRRDQHARQPSTRPRARREQ